MGCEEETVPARKHLVLDYDIHQKLRRRKRETGLTLRQIGNSVLRCVLSQPKLLSDRIGERLVATHRITQEEYQSLLSAVIAELSNEAVDGQTLLKEVEPGTYTAGSWKIRELSLDDAAEHGLAEYAARDARRRSTGTHIHRWKEILLVLSGEVLVMMGGEHRLVGPTQTLVIPAGTAHSKIPLTRETRALVVFLH